MAPARVLIPEDGWFDKNGEHLSGFKERARDSFDLIADLPDRWDHNRFYRSRVMRLLPDGGLRALDVGCGTGEFTCLLADRFEKVVGVDFSPRMIEEANRRNPHPRIEYRLADIEEMELENDSLDAIVSIAAMHHTDMDALLPRLSDSLRQNGVLVVLDLYIQRTPLEYALNAVATPLTVVTDLVVHRGGKPDCWKRLWREHWQIDRHITPTSKELKEIAGRHLPGSVLKRHLFWRYSLVFVKSGVLQSGERQV